MGEKNIDQEFRLKNVDGRRYYFAEEIEQNELMIKKYKKFCKALNYIEHFFILAFAATTCVSISNFVSLVGFLMVNTSSAVGLKNCEITAANKKYKSLIKKKKRKHDKIVLLPKTKLNSIEVF